MGLSIIVAVAKNGVIGKNNTLPWHLPADLKYFKSVTLGKPIIMGRRTYESIGRPLPGRLNIVVTRQSAWQAEGVVVAAGLDEAIGIARKDGASEIMLIGGAQLYQVGMSQAEKIYVTEIDVEVDGDAFFPDISTGDWCEIYRENHSADEKNRFAYSFVQYSRVVEN